MRMLAAVAGFVIVGAGTAQAEERVTGWTYAGLGPSQQLVRIVAMTSFCSTLLPPVVEEGAASVRITVTDRFTGNGQPCPTTLVFRPLFVPLAAPLAGRKLLGAGVNAGTYIPSPTARAPRVVGLSPGDASTVLRGASLQPVVVRRVGGPGLRRIVAQRGARLVVGGSVRP